MTGEDTQFRLKFTSSSKQNMNAKYSSESIKVLKGIRAVRQNPAMYIGSTDINGFHQLI